MKKVLLTFVLLACATGIMFAQEMQGLPAGDSLFNDKTAGLFENEFDQQFNVGPDFGAYENNFLNGAIGGKDFALGAGAGGFGGLGFYKAGTLPMSFYGNFGATGITNLGGGSFQPLFKGESSDAMGTKTSYTKQFFLRAFNTNLQFLTKAGGLSIGGYFNFQNSKNFGSDTPDTIRNSFRKTVIASGETTEELNNWNAGTGAPNYIFRNYFSLGVPVAFATGNLNHTVTGELGIRLNNKDGSSKNIVANDDIAVKARWQRYYLGVQYGLAIPTGDRGDEWTVGAELTFRLVTEQSSRKGKLAGLPINETDKYNAGLGFGMKLEGGRLFNFKPSEIVEFKIKPVLRLGLNTAQNSDNAKYPGVLEKNYAKLLKKQPSATDFNMVFELPMGLTITPAFFGKMGIIMGVTPRVGFEVEAYHPGIEKDVKTYDSKQINVFHILEEEHVFGLSMDLGGGVRFDITLNGNNILLLDNLKAQVLIPLK